MKTTTHINLHALYLSDLDEVYEKQDDGQAFRLLTNFPKDKLLSYMIATMHYAKNPQNPKFRITREAPYWNNRYRMWCNAGYDFYGLWYLTPKPDADHIDLSDFWALYKSTEDQINGKTRRTGRRLPD